MKWPECRSQMTFNILGNLLDFLQLHHRPPRLFLVLFPNKSRNGGEANIIQVHDLSCLTGSTAAIWRTL